MIIHIVLFIVANMSIHKKYLSYYSHCSFFIVTNFEILVYRGMIIYLFIYLFFESCARSIFLKFEVCPRIVHFTLLFLGVSSNTFWKNLGQPQKIVCFWSVSAKFFMKYCPVSELALVVNVYAHAVLILYLDLLHCFKETNV